MEIRQTFDYIIIGAGAAGLMLAAAMSKDAFFNDKSILLLDKDAKQTNDRTWCFWEKGEGHFDQLLYKKWHHIYFKGEKIAKRYKIEPYTYKMVSGIDFYNSFLKQIQQSPNITFRQESVENVSSQQDEIIVQTEISSYQATHVFNSIFDINKAKNQNKYPVLQQHFVGWRIKTSKAVFDPDQATYMDFSIPQKGNTRFMYVLPFSGHDALIEYTLFSKDLLPEKEYETAIQSYIKNDLACEDYEIVEKERGSIPMSCYNFAAQNTANLLFIGTAGGWAKPSTGYTFMNTARKIPKLINYIKSGKPLDRFPRKNRFWYYDLLLLDRLANNNKNGHYIFETLFKNRAPQLTFKFLDEKTSFLEDVYFIIGCPKIPFIKALINRLLY